MPDLTQTSASGPSDQAPQAPAAIQQLEAPQKSEVPLVSETAQMPATTKTNTANLPAWPTREILMREMGLTTDEAHKAVYLTDIFDILKKRKSFKHSKDSARAIVLDWYTLSCLFFYYNFKTTKDKINVNATTKTVWHNCFNEAEVMAHPDNIYKNCYFFAPHGKFLLFYQGKPGYGPQPIIKYDMSDRGHRVEYLKVVSVVTKFFSPLGYFQTNAKTGGIAGEQLKRKDLIKAFGVKEGSSQRRVAKFLARKAQIQKAGIGRLDDYTLPAEVEIEPTTEM